LTFEDPMMIEAGPGDGEKDPSATPTQPRHDFSVVQGFQVVGADHHAAGQNAGGDEGWRDALKLELETRAARFHHAVDSAIVLSNDGVIRWLGDPVARLSPGLGVLTPGAVILADEALPDTARDIVKARIELWLAAVTRRILGPLFALDALQEGSEVVRDLAGRLARALGILEREPIKGQLKALAQNDRAELRKAGVRFGAYYVFVPALIKPAARTLALQLWSLQAPGDVGALIAALAQVASSGRTSLLFDKEISREGYRVAGYRPCGERIVRVDVIERLADIIRGAIVESEARAALGPAGHGRSNGFVVSGQMTSLTGCAGEQFASILRSIGFRSVEMKRSEFIASPLAVESPQQRKPPSLNGIPETAAEGRASPATGGDAEASVDVLSASPGAPSVDATLLDSAQPEIPPDALCSDLSRAEAGATSADPPAPATGSEGEKNAEMIVVWRPDRSAPSRRGTSDRVWRNRDQAPESEHLTIGPLGRPDDAGRNRAAARKGRRNKSRHKEPPLNLGPTDGHAATRPPGSVGRRESVRFDEKHRQTPSDRDMPSSHPASERQPRAKVDPNSPFAKLLELRPLLEGQANKRP
jgi:ATP-dependent RNA helicase SUPV3L1/SUV3